MSYEYEDKIVAEIRHRRKAHAASLGFDLKRIVEDLQRQERESGVQVVIRKPRKPERLAKEESA